MGTPLQILTVKTVHTFDTYWMYQCFGPFDTKQSLLWRFEWCQKHVHDAAAADDKIFSLGKPVVTRKTISLSSIFNNLEAYNVLHLRPLAPDHSMTYL
jgi:hypothetical protein